MRLLTSLLFAGTVLLPAAADETPQNFLARLPNLPEDSCQVKSETREAYFSSLGEITKSLDKEIQRRQRQENEQARAMQKAAPKLTKKDRDALADKYLQEKFNLSLEEVQRMKKMSKDGKRAWAESVATEQVAAMDPATVKADQEKNAKMLNLMNELQLRQRAFIAAAGLFAAKFEELTKEFEDEQDKHRVQEQEEAKRREDSGDSSPPPRYNYSYCPRYTPKYRAIAAEYRQFVLGVVPACQQLEKLQFEMLKAQIEQANAQVASAQQMPIPPEPAGDGGAAAFAVIRTYLQILHGSFQYDIDPPPDSGNS
jgi:hypothetical protein